MGKIKAVITGIGGYVPDYILTNEELSRMVDTSDEWITTRVGIKERRIRIIKVDVDKYGVTASQYRIQSVPTLMLFRNGEVLWRTSGVVDKAELLATLDPFLT